MVPSPAAPSSGLEEAFEESEGLVIEEIVLSVCQKPSDESSHGLRRPSRGPRSAATQAHGPPATLAISETFASRQGEGQWTGEASFFIRTSGCNLRCWFCDTPYASWRPESSRRAVEDLVSAAVRANVGHAVVTGGEPLVQPTLPDLLRQLSAAGMKTTLETAGTIDREVAPDLLSLSPKLRDSGPDAVRHPDWAQRHEHRRLPIETMRKLIDRSKQHQLKFVVSDADQIGEILTIVRRLDVEPERVYLMPEAVTVSQLDESATWLKPLAESHGFRHADRMQIRWYGNRRGT